MRRLPPDQLNNRIHRERDKSAFVRLLTLLSCGLMLAGGFVFAAEKHFTAVQYGYQSEQLRRERTRLLEQQAALLLAREQAATPTRLEAAAREIGMQPALAAQIDGAPKAERSLPHTSTAFVNASAAAFRR